VISLQMSRILHTYSKCLSLSNERASVSFLLLNMWVIRSVCRTNACGFTVSFLEVILVLSNNI
jgi:hypothetical protein